MKAEDDVHRIGRTGRAGRPGGRGRPAAGAAAPPARRDAPKGRVTAALATRRGGTRRADAAVPQHPLNLARWVEASEGVRAAALCALDVPYGEHPCERLSVFPADMARAKPARPPSLKAQPAWRHISRCSPALLTPRIT